MKALIDFDAPILKQDWWLENEPGEYALYSEQDVEPTLELVGMMSDLHGGRVHDAMHMLGEVPLVFVDQAMREGWFHDPKAWRRWFDEHPRFKVRF